MAVDKMATLQVINNAGSEVPIPDVGIVIPVTGELFTDPEFLRTLVVSSDLRSLITQEILTANDGVVNLTVQEAIVYLSLLWTRGGMDDISGIRVIASGQTTIAAGATSTLATITRFPNERLAIHMFVVDNVNGLNFAPGLASLGSDSIRAYFERTTVSNQVLLKGSNAHATQDRTLDWAVVAVRP